MMRRNGLPRQIVRTSVGGEKVRVVARNVFGTEPLHIGAARLALRTIGSTIDPASVRALTFSGESVTTVLAGAVAISDPITLDVPAIADLAIDLYLPENTASLMSPLATHNRSLNTNYLSTVGDHTGETNIPVQTLTESWCFIESGSHGTRPHGRRRDHRRLYHRWVRCNR